jgi:hypothetical protein
MTYKITHKNSTVSGNPPTAGDIDVGEIAINAADAELYTKDAAGNIRKFQNTTTGTAAGVRFTQAGTGAVTRTVESKLRDVVSVKDFGAVGDGVTNDTTFFANAFSYLNSGTSPRALFIPAGSYLVNHSTCTITASNRSVFGEGPASRIIIASAPAGGVGIKAEGTSDTNHITDVLISDIAVIASGWTGANGQNGIAVNKADRCSVQRVTVLGDSSGQSWEQGIIFRDTNNGLIANNIVRRISGNGISLDLLLGSENTFGNLVTGNTISIVGDSGIGFHNNVRYSAAVGNTIDQPAVGGGTGIDIAGCNCCLFEGNVISNSGQYGIRLLQNLSYRTVDNVVNGNTVYHPPNAGAYAAINITDTERNTITNNRLLGNSSALTERGIFVGYTDTGTTTHPITGETLYKLRGTVIAGNHVERFQNAIGFDAGGGVTGATLTVDGNYIANCTSGIQFTTASNEVRFTLFGHNRFENCTANASSNYEGIVRNGNPLQITLSSPIVSASTTGTETTVTTMLVPAMSTASNEKLTGHHVVSEDGSYDGIIRYKNSAGTTLASDIFGTVTNQLRWVEIPLASPGLVTVTIAKNGSPPTGTVSCAGLSFVMITYY